MTQIQLLGDGQEDPHWEQPALTPHENEAAKAIVTSSDAQSFVCLQYF